MKAFFKRIKENLKNNPLTTVFSIIELVICGCLGYAFLDVAPRFSWAVGWKLYALAFGAAAIIYAMLLTFTIRLGHDNIMFAAIRRLVKALGGEKALALLDTAEQEVIELEKAEKERKAEQEAAEKALIEQEELKKKELEEKRRKEEEILAYAIKREEEAKEQAAKAEQERLINKYKAEYEMTHVNPSSDNNEKN